MMHPTYNIIVDLINTSFPQGRLNILDFGCGDGLLLHIIPNYRIGHYEGYDINPNSIKKAKRKYANDDRVSFYQIGKHSLSVLERSKNIDVIISIGVLQYMSDEEIVSFLHHANRILKKGSMLVLSCAVNHWVYKLMNLYKLFLPHRYIERAKLIRQLEQSGLSVTYQKEKGFFLCPLFSGMIFLVFDILDKVIFRKTGSLGPVSKRVRSLANILFKAEYSLPLDFGYTLFIKAAKEM